MLDSITRVTGIIKFDLHGEPESGKTKFEVGGNVQGIFDLGPGRFGSEAIFVPRKLGISSEEDDGYLIFFVHDEASGYVFLSHTIIYYSIPFILSVFNHYFVNRCRSLVGAVSKSPYF